MLIMVNKYTITNSSNQNKNNQNKNNKNKNKKVMITSYNNYSNNWMIYIIIKNKDKDKDKTIYII